MYTGFNIIGIDPGNNLGVSIYTLDAISLEIRNIETQTYVLNNIAEDANNLYRLLALTEIIHNLYNKYQPLAVGIESAFMNFRFPKAIINLAQYVGLIELEFSKLNKNIKIFKYAPKYIKSAIIKGDASKADMITGLSKIQEVAKFMNFNLTTEHAVDATAIGYVTLNELRTKPWLLLAI